jgi:hypothetical protein
MPEDYTYAASPTLADARRDIARLVTYVGYLRTKVPADVAAAECPWMDARMADVDAIAKRHGLVLTVWDTTTT